MANYQRILRIVILIDALLGLVLLLWPGLVAGGRVEHSLDASTWARGAGLFLILLSLALLPAAVFALANRYLALFAAAARSCWACSLPSPALVSPGCWQSICSLPLTCCRNRNQN